MNNKVKRGVTAGLLILAVILFAMAWKEYQPFAEAKTKQQAVITTVVSESKSDDPMDRRIDFDALKKINPDIIGWLYAPQIGVDNPILIGESDTEYLTKAFDGSYSVLGSIFTWSDASEQLSDPHVCLFGHNMMSGQIFGQLHKYEEKAFQEEHPYLYLYTPERTKELTVSEAVSCKSDDKIFQKEWESETDSQIITLATCTDYEATPNRLAVNCQVTKEKLIL